MLPRASVKSVAREKLCSINRPCNVSPAPPARSPATASSNSPVSAPGPFACMMLADMGADVVTLDRVGANKNLKSVAGRGRKVVELDLKQTSMQSRRCSICFPLPMR